VEIKEAGLHKTQLLSLECAEKSTKLLHRRIGSLRQAPVADASKASRSEEGSHQLSSILSISLRLLLQHIVSTSHSFVDAIQTT
jgi:hypothetical protein